MPTEMSEDIEMDNMYSPNKVHVKIGRKYEAAFRSICNLVSNGYIHNSIVTSCREDRIETSQYVFDYTGEPTAIDTGTRMGMLPSGATWFMNFRNGESSSVISAWHNLIELVAADYHKQYSLVEYVQNGLTADSEEMKSYLHTIKQVAEVLRLPFTHVSEATGADRVEDIYAVSLRLELHSGAGEPRPVLCKVYFRNRANVFFPLEKEEAEVVDGYISNIVGNQRQGEQNRGEETETVIVDNVLNAISKLIRNELSNSFTNSILVTNDTDRDTIAGLIQVEPQSDVCLVCRKLKVLGIAHIRWNNSAFNIYAGTKKVYLAKIGITNTVSLYCCCNSEDSKLIENNTVQCVSAETGEEYKIRLNLEEEDLGLSADDVEKIRNESAFARHLFSLSCSELKRRQMVCTRYRCNSNTVELELDGRTVRKCMDCPYPEVLHRFSNGTVAYTPKLKFDTKTLQPVTTETATCYFCGRSYAVEEPSAHYLCEFCKTSLDKLEFGQADRSDKITYRKYAGMLPLSVRAGALFGKKYCFENEDRLLFAVGKKKFFFDKLKLDDKGVLDQPEKRE